MESEKSSGTWRKGAKYGLIASILYLLFENVVRQNFGISPLPFIILIPLGILITIIPKNLFYSRELKLGVFLGVIWGTVPMFISFFKFERLYPFNIVIQFPGYLAVKLGFGFELAFIAAPLIGILLGTMLGVTYYILKEGRK